MSEPVEKFRKDYKVPDFAIHSVDLTFKIYSSHTQVCFFSQWSKFTPDGPYSFGKVISLLHIKRNDHATTEAPLVLDAEDLVLNKLCINGNELSAKSANSIRISCALSSAFLADATQPCLYVAASTTRGLVMT